MNSEERSGGGSRAAQVHGRSVVWAQEDLRTKAEGKEKDWIKNGRGGNPGLRKFTDVAVWAQEDLRTKAEGKEKDWIKNGRGGIQGCASSRT